MSVKVLLLWCSLVVIGVLGAERCCGWSRVVVTTWLLLRYRLDILSRVKGSSGLKLGLVEVWVIGVLV
ncbi:hypothetical protein Hanom_Chr04g00363651 [Helianthus anomalus]